MSEEQNCRHCDHTHDDHPNGFLCGIEECRCPGFFLDRPWRYR